MVDILYDRQSRITGWNQEKLEQARVAVLGSGTLAQQLLINLAGIGITNLMVQSNGRIGRTKDDYFIFGYPFNLQGTRRIDAIEKELLQINPNLQGRLKTRFTFFDMGELYEFKPDVVVNAQNHPAIVENGLFYCIRKNVRYIAGSSGEDSGKFQVFVPGSSSGLDYLVTNIGSREIPNPQPSGVIAGMIADEVRKLFMPLEPGDEPLPSGQVRHYSLLAKDRCSDREELESIANKDLRAFRALVVGAGAVANSLTAQLALAGFGQIDVIDGDKIEVHNLSRQFAFREHVGESKAKILVKRIKEYAPATHSTACEHFLTEHDDAFFSLRGLPKYDIIFGAVDELAVRKVINTYAVTYKIPYIDGGSDSLRGNLRAYYPSVNFCLDCQIGFEPSLKDQQSRRARQGGCDQARPSVIMPNFIVGSAMVGEALRFFYRKGDSDILKLGLQYDSLTPHRIYPDRAQSRTGCRCIP